MNSQSSNYIQNNFAQQHEPGNLQHLKDSTVSQRLGKIRRIADYLLNRAHQQEWTAALQKDLGKSREEAIVSELSPILLNVRQIEGNLRSWASDKRVESPLAMLGMRSFVRHEPKGHVLIMAPWNYPLLLVVNPLIYAIAAGNAVMIKPSEFAPATSGFLDKMCSELFDSTEVAVVQGGADQGAALLELPFNHIFFTGSAEVGKRVMQAASRHLTSVTLELGGKSPAIIDRDVSLKKVAEKMAWGKCINAGQTCIAPDYAVLHVDDVMPFVSLFEDAVNRFYNKDRKGITTEGDYGRIVNERHMSRLRRLLDDAVQKGATIVLEGQFDAARQLMTPFLLTGVSSDMAVMQEEIFGPILPILTYENIYDTPRIVNQWPRPLALYIMSHSRSTINHIMQHTASGGVAINELLMTIANPSLPFGGINQSGIGKSHGVHGFVEFSNERGVVKRNWFDLRLLYPPLNKTIVNLLVKISRL